MRVAVTGANGFVGRHVCEQLKRLSYSVRALVRTDSAQSAVHADEIVATGNIAQVSDWRPFVEGVDVVIHLAARAHILSETEIDPVGICRSVNAVPTERLAAQAAECGVSRFLFLSTVGVCGEQTTSKPFEESDDPCPLTPYAKSKYEAECRLRKIFEETGLAVVIVRAPLVYGANAKGNFIRLMDLVMRECFLPLGSINNRKTLVSSANLSDLIVRCIEHPSAPGNTFFASDGRSISTPELITLLAEGMGVKAKLCRFPPRVLRLMARVVGKLESFDKLTSSLCVSIDMAKKCLSWEPPYECEKEIRRVAKWYADESNKS